MKISCCFQVEQRGVRSGFSYWASKTEVMNLFRSSAVALGFWKAAKWPPAEMVEETKGGYLTSKFSPEHEK